MTTHEIVDHLKALIQLDIDAAYAYTQAINRIEYHDIQKKLADFRDDHVNHRDGLSALVREMGGVPPEDTPDLKGYLIEGFTALRSMMGTKSALEAMRSNERLTNKKYAEAAKADFPQHVKLMIETNYTDEQRHLEYIEDILALPRHKL